MCSRGPIGDGSCAGVAPLGMDHAQALTPIRDGTHAGMAPLGIAHKQTLPPLVPVSFPSKLQQVRSTYCRPIPIAKSKPKPKPKHKLLSSRFVATE